MVFELVLQAHGAREAERRSTVRMGQREGANGERTERNRENIERGKGKCSGVGLSLIK